VSALLVRLRLRRPPDRPGTWAFFEDFPRVFPYLRPYWRLAIASVAMIGISALFGVIAPWPLAILIDSVLGNKPLPHLIGWAFTGIGRYTLLGIAVGAGVAITAAEHGFALVDNYVNTKLGMRMTLDFRSDMFEHAQRLSLGFHDDAAKGMLMFRLNNQAESIGEITTAIPPLVTALATLAGMFVVAFRLDSELALASLAVVPFIYYSAGYYARRVQPQLMAAQGLEANALSVIYEALSMLRVIVAFGREPHEHRRFVDRAEQAVDARVRITVKQTMFSLGVNLITACGTALVLGLGAYHVLQHRLTTGELMVMLGYIGSIYAPLEQISTALTGLQGQFVALSRAVRLLDREPDVRDAPDAKPLPPVRGAVRFEHVTFSYEGRERTLEDVDFEVQPGQRVAIFGPTGAGKTTLVSLLMRFYDPQEGRILVDGVDIRTVTLKSLRDQISIVLQEPLLFSGPIRENIRYGRLEANDDEIWDAARAANAHDFVSQLPERYATQLGEGGAKVSGGERQRLCVARAFLKDAPIVILDEPTSSVDLRTEAGILEALDRLAEGRTTFLIAHRLSAVRHCDLILVVDGGRLVDRGTHRELIRREGLYRQLWLAQLGGDEAAVPLAFGDGAAQELLSAASVALRGGDREALQRLAERMDDADDEARAAASVAAGLIDLLEAPVRPRRHRLQLVRGARRPQ